MLERMIDANERYADVLARRFEELATLAVHGRPRAPVPDAPRVDGVAGVPSARASVDAASIVLASAFPFESAEDAALAFEGKNDSLIYGRWRNPTVEALEADLAALEGTEAACATASGMAAIAGALLSFCKAGDHIVAPRAMYAESARLLRERFPRWGITTTFVDATDPNAYAAAITNATRVLYLETPANPVLAITDIANVVALAKSRGLVTIADNTFATPFAQTPFALGADIVVHSMTKGLSGHGDVIGGAVCGRNGDIAQIRDVIVKGMGGVLSPFSAFLVARGLRTLALRQRQSCESAYALSKLLSEHPRVARVYHPSLPSHSGHAIARAQMHAYGALVAFELAGPNALAQGRHVLESVRVATHAVSLGDARTLIVHPASTTHSTMPEDARRAAGISDGLIRLSVGLESMGDLWRDLEGALHA